MTAFTASHCGHLEFSLCYPDSKHLEAQIHYRDDDSILAAIRNTRPYVDRWRADNGPISVSLLARYPYRYGHNPEDVPGTGAFEAVDEADAIRQAGELVESGYRNGTWITLEVPEGAYACRKVRGQAVASLTRF